MEAKTFKMYRTVDISETHDANQVNPPDEVQFEGVVFSDGKVAVRWLTARRSVSVWDSMEDLLAIHGHPEYGSNLVWDDEISFKAGIQEVVEFIEAFSMVKEDVRWFWDSVWQSKLKGWGIKPQ